VLTFNCLPPTCQCGGKTEFIGTKDSLYAEISYACSNCGDNNLGIDPSVAVLMAVSVVQNNQKFFIEKDPFDSLIETLLNLKKGGAEIRSIESTHDYYEHTSFRSLGETKKYLAGLLLDIRFTRPWIE
jgi:hypothetical protein